MLFSGRFPVVHIKDIKAFQFFDKRSILPFARDLTRQTLTFLKCKQLVRGFGATQQLWTESLLTTLLR